MCRRLCIFLLTLLVTLSSSGLLNQNVAVKAASTTGNCVGDNVFTKFPGEVVHANHISLYRIPLVGFIPIDTGPWDGHRGKEALDFEVSKAPVVAARSGTIKWGDMFPTNDDGYGYYIQIMHDDDERSIYAHLSQRVAPDGSFVKQGDLIGYSGNSGLKIIDDKKQRYHLHFEVKKKGFEQFVNIRKMLGVHFFTVEQQDRDIDCAIQMPQGQNDGYALGATTTQVTTGVEGSYHCKLAEAAVIVYNEDECQGTGYDLQNNGVVFLPVEVNNFDVHSIYIPKGWSAFIDDGNLTEKNHLCATRSLWDLNVDYFHPVPDRLIAGRVKRIIAFKDPKCGGKNINEHGQLQDLSQYPAYTPPASGGGSDPTTQPTRSCTNIGQFDATLAYLWSEENCTGDISWFSGHPANGPGASRQKSVFVPEGKVLYLSSNNDGYGDKLCLTGSYYSLSEIGWQDKIEWASLQEGNCPVTSATEVTKARVYRGADYQGLVYELDPGSWTLSEQTAYYSMWLPSGWSTTIHSRYGQQQLCFDSSSNLASPWAEIAWIEVRTANCASTQPVCSDLAMPVIMTPSEGDLFTNGVLRVSWNNISGATRYRWQVSTSPSFSYLVRDMYTQERSASTVYALSDWTYYVRVRAENPECASTGGWSTPVRFLVESQQRSVKVTKVWTADENYVEKTTFEPDQLIYFMIRYESTAAEPVPVKVTYDIARLVDGYRYALWPYDVTATTGPNSIVVQFRAPTSSYAGRYTFKGRAEYNGIVSELETEYRINGTEPTPPPVPTCDIPDYPYHGYMLYRDKNCDSGIVGAGGDLELVDLVDDHSSNVVSSIFLTEGSSIRVYNGKGKTGESVCLTDPVSDLSLVSYDYTNLAVNDTIESLQSYDRESCKDKVWPVYVPPAASRLPAPTGIAPYTATVMYTEVVQLVWDTVPGAQFYQVQFHNLTTGAKSFVRSETNTLSFQASIDPGAYGWSVRAMLDTATSTYSDPVGELSRSGYLDVLPEDQTPNPPVFAPSSAPFNLRLSAVEKTSATLTWADTNSDEDGFSITRLIGQSFVEVGKTIKDATSYTDDGLTCNTAYRYKVTAFNSGGHSTPAEISTVTKSCDSPAVKYQTYLPLIQK